MPFRAMVCSVVAGLLLAVAGPAGATPARGSLPLPDGGAAQAAPAMSGSKVVWQDRRGGDWDIYLYDFVTRVETRLTLSPADQTAPSISGTRVAWQDMRNGNADIYVLDLITGGELNITPDPFDQVNPSISGTRVVWQDRRSGSWDVFTRDLSGGPPLIPIVTQEADQVLPRVSGNVIVWEDRRGTDTDVYIVDLASGCETPLALPGDQRAPAIDAGRVVWEDLRGGTAQIRTATASGGADGGVAASSFEQRSPQIAGSLIVWSEHDGARWSVTTAVLGESASAVAPDADDQLTPAMSGNRFAWLSAGAGRIRWSETGAPAASLQRPRAGAVYAQDLEVVVPFGSGAPTIVTGTSLTVEATAADAESGIESVSFTLDGVGQCVATTAPYRCLLVLTSGQHQVEAVARDLVGNVGTAARTISVI